MSIATNSSRVAVNNGAAMRCQCPDCGVHTMAAAGSERSATCPNCSAYGLVLIGTVPIVGYPVAGGGFGLV